MAKLVWDQITERQYETGIDRGVVYPQAGGAYPKGEAWNGLTGVTESPSGAEATPLYANNKKYLELMSAEEFGFTIEAFMYPAGFAACNGEKEVVEGVTVGQQTRVPFGMTYRTIIGNDTEKNAHGYKLHLVWGAMAAPSERAYQTVNDSPEAMTLSWECTTTPVEMDGYEPTAHMEIDSTKVDAEKLAALEAMLYGSESEEAKLPMPAEVIALMTGDAA